MGGDDLASDDEYLFDTGSPRGTAISSDDENGNGISSDDDDEAVETTTTTPTSSKKRKGDNDDKAASSSIDDDADDAPAPSSKKRKRNNKNKDKKKAHPSNTNSKNLLIHAGRGIAMDGIDAQATFLGTLYSHFAKLSEGAPGGRNDDDGDEEGSKMEDEEGEGGDEGKGRAPSMKADADVDFSFLPHLYSHPIINEDEKTRKFRHSDLAAFLRSGPLPSTKRLKNWKHPHSPMVLVVTLSARRSVELMKQLSGLKLPVCKLFAKHMSLEDQVELLKGVKGGSRNNNNNHNNNNDGGRGGGGGRKAKRCYSLAVGTPGRLLKLLRHGRDEPGNDGGGVGGGALRLRHTEVVIFDCHEDSKGWTVCTLKDTSRELMEFVREGMVPQLEKRRGKIKLAMF